MTLANLAHEPVRLIVFGGKDGVGKTTMAAATALELAKEKKVLLFTTDPASSLTDSFNQPIGYEPTPILGSPNLFAIEIDTLKAFRAFKQEHTKDILEILQQGTYLSQEEIKDMFSLDLPGMEEMLSFKQISDSMSGAEYQVYIVDTAPTAHTLRLLMLPNLLDSWIKFIATLRWKYRTVMRAFAGGKNIEKADTFLLGMKQSVNKVRALLHDASKTEFIVVTTPEKMAMAEAENLLRNLNQLRISTRHIILNQLFPQEAPEFTALGEIMRTARSRTEGMPPALPFFDSHLNLERYLDFAEIRRRMQEKYVRGLKEKFGTYTITEVLWQPTEIRGIETLQQLGSELFMEGGEMNA
ncbi:MAG TPA: ArsA family ATPase [Ktedonobacteraceae bacterium]|jgi:arsenite-transporting ATPase|nr:ArsA family ATPase [Ktedonobacteraceae bacterium]